MKSLADLNRYQNLCAWERHRANFPRTRYDSLSETEKAWLRTLNKTLRQIEDTFYPLLDAKRKDMQVRVADPSDWLTEFNLDYRITFYLREDDAEYEEDDDNILMGIEEPFLRQESAMRDAERDWGFGATHVDHAEPRQEFSGELHCYLYHQLYDHCHLDWRDLFRIGSLYVDIKVEEQSGILPVNPI